MGLFCCTYLFVIRFVYEDVITSDLQRIHSIKTMTCHFRAISRALLKIEQKSQFQRKEKINQSQHFFTREPQPFPCRTVPAQSTGNDTTKSTSSQRFRLPLHHESSKEKKVVLRKKCQNRRNFFVFLPPPDKDRKSVEKTLDRAIFRRILTPPRAAPLPAPFGTTFATNFTDFHQKTTNFTFKISGIFLNIGFHLLCLCLFSLYFLLSRFLRGFWRVDGQGF